MRVAVSRRTARVPRTVREAPPDGVLEFRLGDEVLIAAEPARWGRAERTTLDGELRELPGDVRPENLHLVAQVGNLFQRRWPDVRVLLDKGRYLVVDLPPDRAREAGATGACCYRVLPLRESRTIFDVRRPDARRAGREARIEACIDRLRAEEIEADVRHLASYLTRHASSGGFRDAAAWAREQLEGTGYVTRTQDVALAGGDGLNVIADRSGHGQGSRELVLVTAHLDSINSFAGAGAPAPGADDNGSGSAGVLAIARALALERGEHDLRFVLFGGEELGLHGSTQYLATLTDGERARIRAVVNMDMVAARNTEDPTVLLEGGRGVSEPLLDALAEAAGTYTSLTVQTSLDPFNSDHVPFIDAGIPAVLTIEGADRANANVHTDADTVEKLDFDLFLQILTMNVAFVAENLGTPRGDDMSERTDDKVTITIPGGASLVDALRSLPFQLSGRYLYNGGANIAEGRATQSAASLNDPRYRLEEPVYLEERAESSVARATDSVRLTLHVDLDGTDPLGVVSGSVAAGTSVSGATPPHFIGRILSDTPTGTGRSVVVSGLSFRWPDGGEPIDRLSLELAGTPLAIPTAKATFHVRGSDRTYGPYVATQQSTYFREVEMEVDREAEAVACEPLDTHVHVDRPPDVPQENLTLESVFARAGIRITRSTAGGAVTGAGADKRWSYSELHDSMEKHWQAYANKPQWKMWIFLAELAESDQLGGVMFDGDIDEPGGVDRQGTAIFTRCPYFHTLEGGYIQANPPGEEAIKRELFFNLIHETGHAFNLAHSFQKELGGGWQAPAWMPLRDDPQSLSWMNYPDSATPGGAGANATWFYRRFRFRFDPGELLFLRHAPERYVEMGAEAWFEHHGRVPRVSLDPRLELSLRSRRTLAVGRGGAAAEVELGEPLLLELRLRNRGPQPLVVHENLDPSDGLVELAVTNSAGERRPFLPIDHTRTRVVQRVLQPNERLYQLVDLTMGGFGFPFKEPGPYRVEASYRNLDGGAAAAVLQVYVRPPANPDVVPVVNELYDARVGRALYVDGTRVMEDVNEKLDWVRGRLNDLIGERNPTSIHLRTVRYKPLARAAKLVDPASRKLTELPEEPDVFVRELRPILLDQCEAAADTMGHIWFTDVVETYARAAADSHDYAAGSEVVQRAVGVLESRGVVKPVIQGLEERGRMLDAGEAHTRRKGHKPRPSQFASGEPRAPRASSRHDEPR